MPRAVPTVVLLVVLTVSASPPGLTASTVIAPPFERLVADATEIFVGDVTERVSRWTIREGRRLIVTDVTFRTSDVLKGSPGGVATLTFLGGFVGDTSMEVAGMPQFMVGDRDVIFVRDRRATLSPIVAMFHGRFRVVTGRNGGGAFVANNARQPVLRVSSYAAPERLGASDAPLELSAFLATVRRMVGQ